MRKLLVLALATTMLLCMCACGNNAHKEDSAPTTTTGTQGTTVLPSDAYNNVEINWN